MNRDRVAISMMMVSLIMIILVSVKAHAGKGIIGWLGCCCCCEEEKEEIRRPLMVVGVGGVGSRQGEEARVDNRQTQTGVVGRYQSVPEVVVERVVEEVSQEISGKRVRINGEIIKDDIYGGEVKGRGTARDNVVEISNASAKYVWGGYVKKGGEVKNNVVEISSASVGGNMWGGSVFGGRGTARDNIVRISSASVHNVHGGLVGESGEVKNNVVEISSASAHGVCGGSVTTGDSNTVVSGNRVRIVEGKVESKELEEVLGPIGMTEVWKIRGDVYGGRCWRGKVEGNEVELINAEIGKNVYGGSNGGGDRLDEDNSKRVSNNIVRVVGGRVGGNVYGGNAVLAKGEGKEGLVTNNRVRIEGSKVEGSVYGGCISGTPSENKGKVEGNEVELINADIKGDVRGGKSEGVVIVRGNRVVIDGGRIEGNVDGDVVELKGSPKFGKNTRIYGGEGSTLNIETQEQIVVDGIRGFENYNFKKVRANEPSKIKVVGECFSPKLNLWGLDLTRSRLVGKVEGEVKEGDRVNLIETEELVLVTQAKSIEMYKESGLIRLSHERIGTDKELSLKIKGQEATPQAQKLNEVGAAGLIVVGQGLGFLAEKGIEEAVGSVEGKTGAEVFAAVAGERNKYKSGIEMSIEGVRAVGGIAKSMEEGKVVLGGYVEHGKGDYKVEEIEGEGMTRYVGVGGLGRVMIGEEVYMDMSVSVGRQEVELDSKGMNVLAKENIGYENKGMYVGGHVGCGCKREVGEKLDIDIAGKVLLMKQEGKEVEMTNGVPVEFEGVMSGKIKGQARAGYKCKEKVVPYIGIGYEYELLGESKGKVEGVELKEVDLKGGSGIGEIGIVGEVGDININISGRGYIGVREGVEGMLKVGYAI